MKQMLHTFHKPPLRPKKTDVAQRFLDYRRSSQKRPLFLCGDTLEILRELPSASVDCCMTSPPYWGKREYASPGIGMEETPEEYMSALLDVVSEVHRALKPEGSFWLNMGDTYLQKRLIGLPWRVAILMADKQGWILRNSIIWNKVKGGLDNTVDRLRNVHENIFHFVKNATGYYYNVDAIRNAPKQSQVIGGAVVSATGVCGVRYRRQIEMTTALSSQEKAAAMAELEKTLELVRSGKIADFRMVIRGSQRTTHSDSDRVSGRAREIQQKGFYFLKYHPNGSKPGDVWDILPEDTQQRSSHFAPYPEDLCKIPLLATCPEEGIALDPFCGTGTTNYVAMMLNRKSIGVDICADYLETAEQRCWTML